MWLFFNMAICDNIKNWPLFFIGKLQILVTLSIAYSFCLFSIVSTMAHTVFPSRMLYVVAVDFQFYKRIHELPPFYPQNLPISLTKSQNSPQPWWMTTFKSCHVLFKCFFSLCESGWCERRGDDWGWAGQPGPIYRWHRWLQVWERGGRGVFPPRSHGYSW